MDFDDSTPSGIEINDRRRAPRAAVAALAVLDGGSQPPSIWRVTNLSTGGAGLVGDGALAMDVVSLSLHVAGFPALELRARILRRQVLMRAGRAAVRFVDVTEPQARALRDIVAADHAPSRVRRRALVVATDERRAGAVGAEVARLGFSVRRESSPGQAVAWLLREETEVLLVDETIIEADRWGLLKFVRDASPETRRLVIASDVRSFRLYYAIKAGLVDSLVEPAIAGDALARHIAGAAPAPKPPRAGAARDRRVRG